MAASFSTVKAVSTLIVNSIARRGYAAASQASALGSGAPNVMVKKGSKVSANASWGPDPVTGYYRPENHASETDSAELRNIVVNNKTAAN